MLFSQPELAAFLSEHFECAWQSLRPVPRVTIDFGGGHVLRRTLNGNVATWLCTPEGWALDVVPGLTDVAGFRRRAEEALALHRRLRQADDPVALLRAHHAAHAVALAALPDTDPGTPHGDPLAVEARTNARERDPLARALLARAALATPEQLTAELFRDVLGVDLADPYLGLAPYVLGGEGGRSSALQSAVAPAP